MNSPFPLNRNHETYSSVNAPSTVSHTISSPARNGTGYVDIASLTRANYWIESSAPVSTNGHCVAHTS